MFKNMDNYLIKFLCIIVEHGCRGNMYNDKKLEALASSIVFQHIQNSTQYRKDK